MNTTNVVVLRSLHIPGAGYLKPISIHIINYFAPTFRVWVVGGLGLWGHLSVISVSRELRLPRSPTHARTCSELAESGLKFTRLCMLARVMVVRGVLLIILAGMWRPSR